MSTFISLDLDYFGITHLATHYYSDLNLDQNTSKYITNFINKLMMMPVPKIVVNSHEDILKLLNKKKYDTIINIDYHSDLVVEPEYEDDLTYASIPLLLNEGTWANYYIYRETTNYEWWMPSRKKCYYKGKGLCGYGRGITSEWHPTKMGYKKVISKHSIQKLPANIDGVGFCISPNWYPKKEVQFIFDRFPILELGRKKSKLFS